MKWYYFTKKRICQHLTATISAFLVMAGRAWDFVANPTGKHNTQTKKRNGKAERKKYK